MPPDEVEAILVVSITADGLILVGGEVVKLDELEAKLRARPSKEGRLVVQADRSASAALINDVLAAARAGGYPNIAFAVENRKP